MIILASLALAACGKTAVETDGLDTDVVDTDVVDTGPGCTTLRDGSWYGSGSAFGMRMGVTLTMTADECAFTLTEWSMEMGPIADSGAIDADQVTLGGPISYWGTCVGTATEDGESVDGVCSEDGAAFALNFRD